MSVLMSPSYCEKTCQFTFTVAYVQKKTITADAEIGFLKKLTYLNYWNTLAVCHAKAIKPKHQIANSDNSLNKTLFFRRPRGPMTSLKMCLPT